jgi:hypothetical protein
MAIGNNDNVTSAAGGGAFPPERKLNQLNSSSTESLQVEPVESQEPSNPTGSNVLKDDIVSLSSDTEN